MPSHLILTTPLWGRSVYPSWWRNRQRGQMNLVVWGHKGSWWRDSPWIQRLGPSTPRSPNGGHHRGIFSPVKGTRRTKHNLSANTNMDNSNALRNNSNTEEHWAAHQWGQRQAAEEVWNHSNEPWDPGRRSSEWFAKTIRNTLEGWPTQMPVVSTWETT